MKNKYFILYILFSTLFSLKFSTKIFAQNFKNASEYNNFIILQQAKIVQKSMQYVSFSVHSEDASKVEKKRAEVIKQIDEALANVKKMPDFNGDKRLRDETVDVFMLSRNTYNVDFKDANSLFAKRNDSYENLQKYYQAQDKAEKKINDAMEDMKKAQMRFAERNKMQIMTSEKKDSPFDVIGRINTYTRQIELAIFKPKKNNEIFMKAIGEKKATENQRKNIVIEAETALTALKLMPDFNKDANYRDKAIEMVTFYRDFATKEGATMLEVSNKKEINKYDVDSFNAAIKLYNEKSNKIINEYNAASAKIAKDNIPNVGE